MIPNIGANKHHRQRKFVRRSTKQSEVQSTCKMSRGWMMRRELCLAKAWWEELEERWPEASKVHDQLMNSYTDFHYIVFIRCFQLGV